MTAQDTEQPVESPTAEPDGDPTEQPEPEAVQPAEAPDQPDPGKSIVVQSEAGALTIRPNQKSLEPAQIAALVAIGIDVRTDPGVEPHIRPFMHMCQRKGLDPFVREAYLIGRGTGNNRKYTMQTAIDGYRKMAQRTGRFIRVKDVVWTGQDDDDQSYVAMDDGRGGVIMRRRWFDQWPASRGYPGAARVTIEHYDEQGQVTETDAVADWTMYAPFTQAWHWGDKRGEKVYETNDDGSPKMDLNEMWSKGYAHMLAKCAEALAYRKAFPATMSGVYTHEEMHRADQIERDRQMLAQQEARRRAYLSAGTSQPDTDPPTPQGPVRAGVVLPDVVPDASAGPAPEETGQPTPEAGRDPLDPGQRALWLREELSWQAETLGHSVGTLANRAVKMYRKNIEDFNDEEMNTLVSSLRQHVATQMSDVSTGQRYAALTADADVRDVRTLLGWESPTDESEVAEVVEDVDPDSEHTYTDDDGVCRHCGLPEDVGPHPE